MWSIYESSRARKSTHKIPSEILKRYEKWKDIVSISGPQGLKLIKGFHDERLKGQWSGYHSSRLSIQYRVIYRIEKEKIFIEVFDITPHKY